MFFSARTGDREFVASHQNTKKVLSPLPEDTQRRLKRQNALSLRLVFAIKLCMMCRVLKTNFLVSCRFVSSTAVPFALVFSVALRTYVQTDRQCRHNHNQNFTSIGYHIFLSMVLRESLRREKKLSISSCDVCKTLKFGNYKKFLGEQCLRKKNGVRKLPTR